MRTVFRIYELKSAFDLGIEIDRYTNYMVMCKVGYDYETYEAAEEEISKLLDEAN